LGTSEVGEGGRYLTEIDAYGGRRMNKIYQGAPFAEGEGEGDGKDVAWRWTVTLNCKTAFKQAMQFANQRDEIRWPGYNGPCEFII